MVRHVVWILFLSICGVALIGQQPAPSRLPQRGTPASSGDYPSKGYSHNSPEPQPSPTRGFLVPIFIPPPPDWSSFHPECQGSGSKAPEKILSEQGPQLPPQFNMSSVSVAAFVKGNWPVVVDYEVNQPGLYLLLVSAEGVAPLFYQLNGTQPGRRQQILNTPARFGTQPRPGSYTVYALSNQLGEANPIYLRVFGMGAGERAVGSVAIDQLHFTPASIRPKDKQNALYGFHSHADFEKVTAEFALVGLAGGTIVGRVEDKQDLKEVVRRDTEIANKQWDPRKAKASPGQHLFQVRAWYTLKKGGDWVIAWSPQLVRVEE